VSAYVALLLRLRLWANRSFRGSGLTARRIHIAKDLTAPE